MRISDWSSDVCSSERARLELLDEQGIQASLMFPTLASLIEERLLDDPALTQVALRAFNEWLYDEWRYGYEGRIFATPVVNPCVLDEGIAELERLIDRGARRSEEHTSELQSLMRISYAVFRLKKKNKNKHTTPN